MIQHSSPWITDEDRAAVDRVLSTGMIARGVEVEAFETEMARYLGYEAGIATSSGTRALYQALKALEIGAGDEVVIPSYACRAVWNAAAATGATPRLCDVGDGWCVTAESISPALSPRTRAVIVVHTFGIPADPAIAERVSVPVIDDCCQAVGFRSTQLAGVMSVVSFHATKMLTCGEGGMVLSTDADITKRLRKGVEQGRDQLSDLQAALGRSQLRRYGSMLQRRNAIAQWYCDALEGLPVQLPRRLIGSSLFFRFPVQTAADFDDLRRAFAEEGIQVRRGVDTLLHRWQQMDAFAFPNSERMFRDTLSLPLYPALTDEAASRVLAAAKKVLPALVKV